MPRSSQPYPRPTSRRRVVNQQNAIPPTAHCSNTVAASRLITSPQGNAGCHRPIQDDPSTRGLRSVDRPYAGAAMAHCSPSRSGRRAISCAVIAAAAALSGCFTGERPHLAEGATTTGDEAVDEVLALLDGARASTFTAGYDVLTRFGDLRTPASVVQAAPDRRSITVGDVRFIFDGESTATCLLDTGACSDTIDAGQISNTQLAPDFYGSSAAVRLRRDGEARVDSTVASTETIAGQQTTCVTIPVPGGSSIYCALDSGVLARLDAADVLVELTSYSTEPDEQQFDTNAG